MSKITKSLHYQKTNGTSGSCALYSSKGDCEGYSTINLEVDGANVYAGLGTSLTANNASGIRIQKTGSDTKYAILKWTQATITITQVDNETIKVTDASGTAIASGSLLPMNTALTITVTPTDGYNAGAITINGKEVSSPYSITQADIESGTLTITAKAATLATATVTIIQSANQTIHVYTPQKEGGTDHTETFICPIGTTYEVEVIAVNSDYKAGTPNINGGTISRDETINANPATLIIPTGSIEVTYKGSEITFTVPVGIHVLKVELTVYTRSKPTYVGVTPGTIHKLKVTRSRIHSTHQLIWTAHIGCTTHKKNYYIRRRPSNVSVNNSRFTISWSPEINKQTPTTTDY